MKNAQQIISQKDPILNHYFRYQNTRKNNKNSQQCKLSTLSDNTRIFRTISRLIIKIPKKLHNI